MCAIETARIRKELNIMKRKREMEMGASEMKSAIEELSSMVLIKAKDGSDYDTTLHIPTKPFLSICNCLLQVLDKIGPTMFVLRQDVHQNIQRLEKLHDSDPSLYSNMVEILKKERNEGSAKKGPSCSKALVWLTRSLDFTSALLQLLVEDLEKNMEEAVEESYNITLKPWHGWISSAAYGIAVKLVPDSTSLMRILMSKQENNSNDNLNKEIRTLVSLLVPVLQEIHNVLETYGLNRLKAT
nr:glycolipid transfer protein 3-like [Ipomoea batatas]GME04721.1 glycolipid transfer protein 3-like [Ipomoea batatas]